VAYEPGDELRWHVGRPCDHGACVEIAMAGEEVLVRSSVAPGQLLSLSHAEWREFLASAKEGRFDHL
jgi:hypothetical protein